MDAPQKKTHEIVPKPDMSVRNLADYMAASERKKRAIVESCKYRPVARILQHREAQNAISSAYIGGIATPQGLKEKADSIRNKLADDDFAALTNEANADYLEAYGKIVGSVELPKGEILPGKTFPPFNLNGVKIRFTTRLMFRRLTKTNKLRRGGMMLRYAKGKKLHPDIGGYQSAAIFGVLGIHDDEEGSDPDKTMCITVDAMTGSSYPAPTNAVSIFANMKAACQSIAERWPNIAPPASAVL